jgi:hypothetical protein
MKTEDDLRAMFARAMDGERPELVLRADDIISGSAPRLRRRTRLAVLASAVAVAAVSLASAAVVSTVAPENRRAPAGGAGPSESPSSSARPLASPSANPPVPIPDSATPGAQKLLLHVKESLPAGWTAPKFTKVTVVGGVDARDGSTFVFTTVRQGIHTGGLSVTIAPAPPPPADLCQAAVAYKSKESGCRVRRIHGVAVRLSYRTGEGGVRDAWYATRFYRGYQITAQLTMKAATPGVPPIQSWMSDEQLASIVIDPVVAGWPQSS